MKPPERALQYVDQLEAHLDEGGRYAENNVRDLIQMVRELAQQTEQTLAALQKMLGALNFKDAAFCGDDQALIDAALRGVERAEAAARNAIQKATA